PGNAAGLHAHTCVLPRGASAHPSPILLHLRTAARTSRAMDIVGLMYGKPRTAALSIAKVNASPDAPIKRTARIPTAKNRDRVGTRPPTPLIEFVTEGRGNLKILGRQIFWRDPRELVCRAIATRSQLASVSSRSGRTLDIPCQAPQVRCRGPLEGAP